MNTKQFKVKSSNGDTRNDAEMDENLRNKFTQLDDDYEKLLLNFKSLETKYESILSDYNEIRRVLQVKEDEIAVYADNFELLSCVATNAVNLVEKLPQNSPIRRPLVKELSHDVDKEKFMELFEISTATYYRCQQEPDDNILFLKYPTNVTKDCMSEEMAKIIAAFLDQAMPFVSGRNYRIQSGTFQYVYDQYKLYLKDISYEGKPVAKSYLRKCVCKDNVRKIVKVDICPICSGTTKKKYTNEEIEDHKQLCKLQKQAAMKHLKDLRTGVISGHVIVQDFTQVQLSPSGFIQDLILVHYEKEEGFQELKRTYYHYIGGNGDSNNLHFVKGCWNDLLAKIDFKDHEEIRIWSDGSRKHFKQSGQLKYMMEIQNQFRARGIVLQYNFYGSYHGHNACDAAAWHAKRLLINYQLNTGKPISGQSDVTAQLQNLKNSNVSNALIIDGKPPKVPTMKGVSKLHCFLFPKPNFIAGYLNTLMQDQPNNFSIK